MIVDALLGSTEKIETAEGGEGEEDTNEDGNGEREA